MMMSIGTRILAQWFGPRFLPSVDARAGDEKNRAGELTYRNDELDIGYNAKPSQAKPSQAKPSQAKPSQAKPSQAKPSQAKPSQAKPSQAKPSRVVCPPSEHASPRFPNVAAVILVLSLVCSAQISQAQTMPDDLTEDVVMDFISDNDIDSVAKFVDALPPLHKKHFITLYESASPAKDIVDVDSPRVVSWGSDSRFILAWTQDGPEQVEFLEQGLDTWTAGLISFSGGTAVVSHPDSCATCHGPLDRPIWGARRWDGTASSPEGYDMHGMRKAAPSAELQHRSYVYSASHERLAPLDRVAYWRQGSTDFIHIMIPGSFDSRYANTDFSNTIALRHAEVLFERLRSMDNYLDLVYEAMGDLGWVGDWVDDVFTQAGHHLSKLADGTIVMDNENAPSFSNTFYKGGYGGSLGGILSWLVLNDLRKIIPSVEDLYDDRLNDSMLQYLSTDLEDEVLRYGLGEASAADEMDFAENEFILASATEIHPLSIQRNRYGVTIRNVQVMPSHVLTWRDEIRGLLKTYMDSLDDSSEDDSSLADFLDTTVILKNTVSGLESCLDVKWAAARNGQDVQTWECNNTNAQDWTLKSATVNGESRYRLVSGVGDGDTYCLDNRGDFHDGGRVGIWTCVTDDHGAAANQTFQLIESGDGYEIAWSRNGVTTLARSARASGNTRGDVVQTTSSSAGERSVWKISQ